ncbi:MAG: adenine deaminase [Lachnospiraceae bacterium]|nr:adenine deaminase [Lachnospiraceae bacterium]
MKEQMMKIIDVAAGRKAADLIIKNGKVVNVYGGNVIQGDIAITEGKIAGVGAYGSLPVNKDAAVMDAAGSFVAPGFIDSHIHIESSYVSPEELGRMVVPHGGTTIIADPHEIVNVCGLRGLDYMLEAGKRTKLDIQYMLPSCVPSTPFETSGANIDAEQMEEPLKNDAVLGLGEFMDFVGVIGNNEAAINKLVAAKKAGKVIDGHAAGVAGMDLNAYASCGIAADHECATIEEINERIASGMYVMLREGSACHNLRDNLKAVTKENAGRFVLCSDDRQPKTMLNEGHLDNHLRICVEEGLDAITALRMATVNAAECFGLKDRGAIAPGKRADLVFLKDLKNFEIRKVFIAGELVAENGTYLPEIEKYPIDVVKNSVRMKDFSAEKLKMHLKSNRVNTVKILPGGVVTEKKVETVKLDEAGEFIKTADIDVAKFAVVERHKGTGNVACGFLNGYGIQAGAIAVTIAHDSHNIIVVGVSDEEMEAAVNALQKQEGGAVLVKDGQVIESMPLPIAGLMSDQSGEWVNERLTQIHKTAHEVLGINEDVEPVMTLTFMSLAVIPEIRLTDMGLFDVNQFAFISVEAE